MLSTWAGSMVFVLGCIGLILIVSLFLTFVFLILKEIWDYLVMCFKWRSEIIQPTGNYRVHPLDDRNYNITPQTEEEKYLERLGI